uniref:Uncharacterized protein n=1 Tax=Zonotrichia albicollis TaxID=44394 RepID=A0A8D2MFI2_ZONAL
NINIWCFFLWFQGIEQALCVAQAVDFLPGKGSALALGTLPSQPASSAGPANSCWEQDAPEGRRGIALRPCSRGNSFPRLLSLPEAGHPPWMQSPWVIHSSQMCFLRNLGMPVALAASAEGFLVPGTPGCTFWSCAFPILPPEQPL